MPVICMAAVHRSIPAFQADCHPDERKSRFDIGVHLNLQNGGKGAIKALIRKEIAEQQKLNEQKKNQGI